MPNARSTLTANTLAVLEMIAAGKNYEQILAALPALSYLDIFRAAEEALQASSGLRRSTAYTLADKRATDPRAYESWTVDEENTLRELVASGTVVKAIANRLQRNLGAIRSRMKKLNLG